MTTQLQGVRGADLLSTALLPAQSSAIEFYDDFETRATILWGQVGTNNGTPTIATNTMYNGVQSMQITSNASEGEYKRSAPFKIDGLHDLSMYFRPTYANDFGYVQLGMKQCMGIGSGSSYTWEWYVRWTSDGTLSIFDTDVNAPSAQTIVTLPGSPSSGDWYRLGLVFDSTGLNVQSGTPAGTPKAYGLISLNHYVYDVSSYYAAAGSIATESLYSQIHVKYKSNANIGTVNIDDVILFSRSLL